jgi:hypothetical protein
MVGRMITLFLLAEYAVHYAGVLGYRYCVKMMVKVNDDPKASKAKHEAPGRTTSDIIHRALIR